MRLPFYAVFNFVLASTVSVSILGILRQNAADASGQARALDSRLDLLAREWLEHDAPAADRTLTILLLDAAAGPELLDAPLDRPFFSALGSSLRRKTGGSRPAALLAGPEVFDWSMDGLQWASDKERRMNELAAALVKADRAHARINIVAQGFGARLALDAVAAAGSPPIEKLVTLGAVRTKLKAPAHVKEWACLSPAGAEYRNPEGEWTRLPLDRLGAESIARLLEKDGSMKRYFLAAGFIKPTVTGRWKGRYFYPETGRDKDKPPVEFEAALTQRGGGFEGTITERNTMSSAPAVLRAFVMAGTVDDAGTLRFVKKYDGAGGIAHSVEYRGVLSPEGGSAAGTWLLVGGLSGRFEMSKRP